MAASVVVAVSFFALGFPGAPLQAGKPASPAGSVSLPGLGGGFLTDSRALVPFSRTIITTVAKDGRAELNVASAGLKRPPEGSLMAPLEVLRPSSPFGYRISPLSGAAGDFHLGQDYAAGCGTRVYAADAGVVRAAGWHPWGGGNRVEIDHGNGLITTYNHLEAIAVRAGDSVQVGQVIARVGTTGWSTGCHLHFETILRGKHTSPLNWTLLPTRQVDALEDIAMVSYDGKASSASEGQRWAIPVAADHSHTVLNGEQELAEAPEPEPAAGSTPGTANTATAAPTSTPAPSGSPTATPTNTATATPTTTAAPSPSVPTSPTSSSPSGTSSASPTPTTTGTSSPAPTGTSPTPVPTGTTPAATVPSSPTPTSSIPSPSWPTLKATATPAEPTAIESSAEAPTPTEPTAPKITPTASTATAPTPTVTEPAP
ncbi:M23 family metallopeptidase [Pseudarthrobacter sp. NPDC055928]|uniref:M23 family metallopeptidase n=1 Tax=Pseudarthrobacter sp. NPDC055928 TaxID=3345661 RepID=UPI0035D5456A